jgi:Holliday junction DNA helicase RuvB
MSEDLLAPEPEENELAFEAAVRPTNLEQFVGQQKVRAQLQLVLESAKLRGTNSDHILLVGPPGLGKTTLALIVSNETGHPIRLTSGPTIQHAGDLASILSSLAPGEILFIDEIHRMSRSAEEMLYLAMEDYRVDVMVGKGVGANSIPLELSPFTLIGATTRSGMLPTPLRDRFGFTGHLEFYDADELQEVVRRSAVHLNVEHDESSLAEIARRSRGTPRIANRLLRRVRDFALVHDHSVITVEVAKAALSLYEVDELGLDRIDKQLLELLTGRYANKSVGLSTLAVALGEEADTIESVVEPYLVRTGLIVRTPRGREATPAAYLHMGKLPHSISTQTTLDL